MSKRLIGHRLPEVVREPRRNLVRRELEVVLSALIGAPSTCTWLRNDGDKSSLVTAMRSTSTGVLMPSLSV